MKQEEREQLLQASRTSIALVEKSYDLNNALFALKLFVDENTHQEEYGSRVLGAHVLVYKIRYLADEIERNLKSIESPAKFSPSS